MPEARAWSKKPRKIKTAPHRWRESGGIRRSWVDHRWDLGRLSLAVRGARRASAAASQQAGRSRPSRPLGARSAAGRACPTGGTPERMSSVCQALGLEKNLCETGAAWPCSRPPVARTAGHPSVIHPGDPVEGPRRVTGILMLPERVLSYNCTLREGQIHTSIASHIVV